MFDRVPLQVWLLIVIAVVAYAPALYIYRFVAHSPSRRDITQPSEDLSWRTSGQLARSLSILVALIALAVFIFTPAAAVFASSPGFLPILIACAGAWALFTVPTGFVNGKIQPFIRGISNTYERRTQPNRFWASMGWNALFGCLCIWLAFINYEQASAQAIEDKCYDENTAHSPQEMISACDEVIAKYSEAIRLNPRDSYPYYNRGLAHERVGEDRLAITDYGAAIRLRPSDANAHLNRGLIFLDTGRFDEAVADFTRAHELQPKSPWPLANRGITYAWMKDQARAEKDFKAVRAIDPSNPVVLRGEALLSMNAGDMEAAVVRLTAALNRDPKSKWSLRKRAEAYRHLGEYEKSQADINELLRLSKDTARLGPPSTN